jgi:hypothetical protein
MTSNLEVVLFHWKNTIDFEAHRGEMVDAIRKVREVPGAKKVRWGIQSEDPKIAVMFAGALSPSPSHPSSLFYRWLTGGLARRVGQPRLVPRVAKDAGIPSDETDHPGQSGASFV